MIVKISNIFQTSVLYSFYDKSPKSMLLSSILRMHTDTNGEVYERTMRSRKARNEGNIDEAKKLKSKTPMYIPAVLCKGGRTEDCITALTGCCISDTDEIPLEDMPRCEQIAKTDSHTLFANVTNSERGIRVIFRWVAVDENGEVIPDTFFVWDGKEAHDEFIARVKPYHSAAWKVGNAYYAERLGHPCDEHTKDINRLSFMAHDPKAVLNEEAEPFVITPDMVEPYKRQCHATTHHAAGSQIKSHYFSEGRFSNVFDLVEDWVSRDVAYTMGHRNQYITRCMFLLCEFGVLKEGAIFWGVRRFSDYGEKGVIQTANSCYRKAKFNTKTFNNLKHEYQKIQ